MRNFTKNAKLTQPQRNRTVSYHDARCKCCGKVLIVIEKTNCSLCAGRIAVYGNEVAA